MDDEQHIIISLENRYAEEILSGRKKVELRRRRMNVEVGTTVWIYVKVPVGCVVGRARISGLHSLAPSTLWRRFSGVSGLTRSEFDEYYQDVTKGFALSLDSAKRLSPSVSLQELRNSSASSASFQPPQFFMRLDLADSLTKTLIGAKKRKRARDSVDA